MKKRILILALAAIIAGCAIGGTMAYYTNQGTATNVITAGNIRAELQEWADLDMTTEFTNPEDPIVPGDDVIKVVTAKNTGDFDAWIRIRVETTAEADNTAEGAAGGITAVELPLALDINTEDWTEQDGWYYYNAALTPGQTTEPLFTTVSFDTKAGNEWQGADFYIRIAMQATQVANNGASALEAAAASWPATTP